MSHFWNVVTEIVFGVAVVVVVGVLLVMAYALVVTQVL